MTEPLKIVRAAIQPANTQNASRDWTGAGKNYGVILELSRPLTGTERAAFTQIKAASFEYVEVPDRGSTLILHGTTIEEVRDNKAQLSEHVRLVAEAAAQSDAESAATAAALKDAERAEADRRRSIAESINFD